MYIPSTTLQLDVDVVIVVANVVAVGLGRCQQDAVEDQTYVADGEEPFALVPLVVASEATPPCQGKHEEEETIWPGDIEHCPVVVCGHVTADRRRFVAVPPPEPGGSEHVDVLDRVVNELARPLHPGSHLTGATFSGMQERTSSLELSKTLNLDERRNAVIPDGTPVVPPEVVDDGDNVLRTVLGVDLGEGCRTWPSRKGYALPGRHGPGAAPFGEKWAGGDGLGPSGGEGCERTSRNRHRDRSEARGRCDCLKFVLDDTQRLRSWRSKRR